MMGKPAVTPFLEARGIYKRFPGVLALNNVNATFFSGEVVAVVGENGAGKSTLMKILAGIYHPDEGEVLLEGKGVKIPTVSRATELGIAFIHQELNLSDNLSIAANIFLGREPRMLKPLNFINRKAINQKTCEMLEQLQMDCAPEMMVRELSIGHQQMVEIAKALSQNARMIIMDEPTSSLTSHETDRLFELIRSLKARGVCIVYISHRLVEVDQIADRVIVLRDGQNSGELERSAIDHDRMVSLMVGRELTEFYQHRAHKMGEPRLEVSGLVIPGRSPEPISFTLHAGEVVGMAGLVGAGRTELAQAIFGIQPPLSGTIKVDGELVRIKRPSDAIDMGIILVPEDRRTHGLILEFAVRHNIALSSLKRYQRAKFIREKEVTRLARTMVDELNVKTTSIESETAMLSGGNQQKVVLAKWISLRPKVLLLDEPTRGVDVMSKSEIYQLIEKMASQGIAVLVVSSDLEEILRISDRVLVMHEGKLAGELQRRQLSEEAVMNLATGRE
jgi:ribose transport system ATP-binding protein